MDNQIEEKEPKKGQTTSLVIYTIMSFVIGLIGYNFAYKCLYYFYVVPMFKDYGSEVGNVFVNAFLSPLFHGYAAILGYGSLIITTSIISVMWVIYFCVYYGDRIIDFAKKHILKFILIVIFIITALFSIYLLFDYCVKKQAESFAEKSVYELDHMYDNKEPDEEEEEE